MGRLHAERIVRDRRGRITCCCDLNREAAVELAARTGSTTRVAGRWDEVAGSNEVDAVVICTPTTEHHDQILAALDHGKHVLCEKPLADSHERIERLISASHSAVTKTMVAYQRRFWSSIRTLRREVLSGEHGQIRAVVSHSTERWQQTIAGTWRDDPAVNIGGFMGDAGSHKMDLIFHVTGLGLEEVYARSQNCGSKVEVLTSVSAVLSGGVPLTMDFIGNAQHLGESFSVHCEEADLMLRDNRVWIARHNQVKPIEHIEPESDPVTGFIDYLQDGGDNTAPFSSALPVFDFLTAVQESSRTGMNVVLR
jgi:predicted dehydrogenase